MLFNIVMLIYSAATAIAERMLSVAGRFSGKIARRAEARGGEKKRWSKGAGQLDKDKKTVWFHVASVGEYLQGKPVISLLALNESVPLQIALTFSSPSGVENYEKFRESPEREIVSFVDYLPVDTLSNVRFCLDTLDPDLIVYVKYDLWPNLIREAADRGIPQALISGGLSESSGRYSFPWRYFFGELYSLLDIISASTGEDAERFRSHSPGAEVITVGDTKYDQVFERAEGDHSDETDRLLPAGPDYLIAGSTWPEDEEIIIPGYARLRDSFPEVSLVIAPHEPLENRIEQIIQSAGQNSLEAVTLSEIGKESRSPVIIADGIGYLARLYRHGCIAYVGGGFSSGVHNVLEPAVMGVPVLFGPRVDNSHEAKEIADLGAGVIIETENGFIREGSALLADGVLRSKRGREGRKYIESKLGVSERYRDLLIDMIR
jgi:3-deoxy-D-manno-octulosonic-acid transferase